MRRKESRLPEGGQLLPFVGLLLGAVMLIGVLVSHVAAAANVQAQAQTAADAGALVGVRDGRQAAAQAVRANGAEMQSFEQVGADVVVKAALKDRSARSRATLGGGLPMAAPPG